MSNDADDIGYDPQAAAEQWVHALGEAASEVSRLLRDPETRPFVLADGGRLGDVIVLVGNIEWLLRQNIEFATRQREATWL